jgi:membrane protease YdiL (CAAX protease family)
MPAPDASAPRRPDARCMALPPPPPGTPYHRLARTPAHRWWRAPLGTTFVLTASGILGNLLALLGTIAVAAATGNLDQDGFEPTGPAEVAYTLVVIACALPVVLLAARWIQRRRAGTVSSVLGRLRWGWLGTCLMLAVPMGALLIAVEGALAPNHSPTGGKWIGWEQFGPMMAMIMLLVPLQAAAEEYLFRGWFLQAIGAFFRTPWYPIAVQALLFAGAHGGQAGAGGLLMYCVVGAVAGVLAVRTGGLEASIALHVVFNIVALGLAAAGDALTVEFGDVPLTHGAGFSLVVMAYGAVVLIKAKRRRVEAVVPASAPSPEREPVA